MTRALGLAPRAAVFAPRTRATPRWYRGNRERVERGTAAVPAHVTCRKARALAPPVRLRPAVPRRRGQPGDLRQTRHLSRGSSPPCDPRVASGCTALTLRNPRLTVPRVMLCHPTVVRIRSCTPSQPATSARPAPVTPIHSLAPDAWFRARLAPGVSGSSGAAGLPRASSSLPAPRRLAADARSGRFRQRRSGGAGARLLRARPQRGRPRRTPRRGTTWFAT